MNIDPIKDLLSSMAPINQMHYQIWDNNGTMSFSTENAPTTAPPLKEIQDLSDGIINQKDFRYTVCNGHDFLCGIPVRNDQNAFDALVAFGRIPEGYSRYERGQDTGAGHAVEMERFLGNLAQLAETSLDTSKELEEMTHELEQSFEDLYLYGQIANQIKALKVSGRMLESLLNDLLDNMRAEAAFILLPDQPRYNLHVTKTAFLANSVSQKNFFKQLVSCIPANEPSLKENYFIVNDSRENAKYMALSKSPYRLLTVRVQHHEKFYGWLGLVSFNLKEIFRQGELKLLISIAEQLAVVIANTDLYKDLEQFIINMVRSLIFAIEAKDVYTRGHSERVSKYSMWLGERLGLEREEYNNLKWASILHDIGKIGIPESILNKPGRLTDEEFEIIKGHPQKGGEILQPVEQLAESLPGIIHHHERYDGKGYPQGLKGEEIPLNARIIAAADTFDAISSSRAYRAANSLEKALSIVEEVAGTQLDSRIVAIFKEVYSQKIAPKEIAST